MSSGIGMDARKRNDFYGGPEEAVHSMKTRKEEDGK